MRKLFLAHFSFTTGKVEFNEQRLLVLNQKEIEEGSRVGWSPEITATEKATRWFKQNFTESDIHSCMAFDAIDEVATDTGRDSSPKAIDESPFVASFPMTEIPPHESEDPLTCDVLVDVDGERTRFVIGYYDIDGSRWIFNGKGSKIVDYKHARWFKLPLAK